MDLSLNLRVDKSLNEFIFVERLVGKGF